MSSYRKANLKMVVRYFTSNTGILCDDLNQIILEFSGCLRIGRKSLMYMTYNMPKFCGIKLTRVTDKSETKP